MTQPNGHNGNGSSATIQEPAVGETAIGTPARVDALGQGPPLATRARQRTRQHIQQNRFVIVGAGAIVVALLIFVATSMPGKRPPPKSKTDPATTTRDVASESSAMPGDKSLFPITDSGRPAAKETHDGFLNERDLQRTATGRPTSGTPRAGQGNTDGTLASIPPFGEEQSWQAPPYQPGTSVNNVADLPDPGKAEREAMEKSSLVYVRRISALQEGNSRREEISSNPGPDIGLGLATGTRLRARLDSAASTAVRTPVLAVIEYNYERNGEILVPAGARVIGHMQDADRSGYVRIEFDSLLMPDGAAMPIQAVATDLEMRPLKGKVEGKNTGKNVLVRSLSGIGQVGATLVGRGNLNQPLSESDLVRERVSNNIGEAGDEQISRMAVTQHIVVTISADTPIYVVLEQTPKSKAAWTQSRVHNTQLVGSPNAEELRQLLQPRRELNQSSTPTP
jgi:type IV secretory pathway VirB10-like protein